MSAADASGTASRCFETQSNRRASSSARWARRPSWGTSRLRGNECFSVRLARCGGQHFLSQWRALDRPGRREDRRSHWRGSHPGRREAWSGQRRSLAVGAALGALYGVAAEYWPQITSGLGTAFGFGATLVLDEALVPAAGLGKLPTRTSLGTHAYSATSHLIYGGALEATRRLIRSKA